VGTLLRLPLRPPSPELSFAVTVEVGPLPVDIAVRWYSKPATVVLNNTLTRDDQLDALRHALDALNLSAAPGWVGRPA
jgi:hypothetical protein